MTPPKKWPHQAEWARLDAISLAIKARNTLLVTLNDVDNPAALRRMAQVIETLREIETVLKTKGETRV